MRRQFLIFGLLALLVSFWSVWWFRYHGQPLSVICFPPPAETPYPVALDEMASLDVGYVPLNEALQQLARRHDVEIVLDRAALQAVSVTGQERVTCRLIGVPLRVLLELLVSRVHESLVIDVRDGRAYVSTLAAWLQPAHFIARIYRPTPLLATSGGWDEQQLGALIGRLRSTAEWDIYGGPAVLRILPGAVLVSHLPEVHRHIEMLLARLEKLQETNEPLAPLDLSDPYPEATAAVTRALDREVRLEFGETRLEEALARISREQELPIWLDRRAAEDGQTEPDQPLTCTLPPMSLQAALHLLLDDLGLKHTVHRGVVVVTNNSWEVTESSWADAFLVRLYPVGDLLAGMSAGSGQQSSRDREYAERAALRGVLSSSAAPNIWWGNHPVDCVQDYLVIDQPWEGHRDVERLLAAMRRAKWDGSPNRPGRPEDPTRADGGSPTAGSLVGECERIERALAQQVSLSFQGAPVADVARELERQFCIPLRFFRGSSELFATETVRLGPDGEPEPDPSRSPSLVTYAAEGKSLAAALHAMLRPLALDFVIRGETVRIVRLGVGDGGIDEPERRIYRVRRFPPGDPRAYDVEELAAALSDVLPPRSNTMHLQHVAGLVLATATRQVHERLAVCLGRLEQLRAAPDQTEPLVVRAPQDGRDGQGDEIRLYPLAHLRPARLSPVGRVPAGSKGGSGFGTSEAVSEMSTSVVQKPFNHRGKPGGEREYGLGDVEADARNAWYRAWTAAAKPASRSQESQREGGEGGHDAPWSGGDGGFAAWRIGELVRTVVRPSSWEWAPWPEPAHSAAGHGLAGGGVMACLPDLLLVRQSSEVHDEIRRLLQVLADPAGFPLPWEMDFGSELPPECDLINLTRGTTDPVRRAYGLTLLATLRYPPAGLGDLLGGLLGREEVPENRGEQRLLGVLLTRLMATDRPEAALLQQRVRTDIDRRRRTLRALIAAGPAAGPATGRLLGISGTDFKAILGSLRNVGTAPQEAIPYLLSTFVSRPDPGLVELMDALDPSRRTLRKLLDRRQFQERLPKAQVDQIESLLQGSDVPDQSPELQP